MKARHQVTIPSVHLTHTQPMYEIAIYLEHRGEMITLLELEHGVEDLYKVVPPFFLKGAYPSKAGQCLSYKPRRWGAKKYLIPGAQLFAVMSPNRIFLFSDQPLRSDQELLDLVVRDPEFYEEEEYEPAYDEYEPSDEEREGSDYQEYLDDQDYEENPPGMNMPPAIQWGMWILHTAGMLMNPPPRIVEESVGYHHGQSDLTLNAYGETNQLLGYISYSEFPAGSNKIHVNWMYVSGAMRRQGIGTLLVLALQDKYKKIHWGFTTPEGTGLLEKIEKLKKQKMAFLPGGKGNPKHKSGKRGRR